MQTMTGVFALTRNIDNRSGVIHTHAAHTALRKRPKNTIYTHVNIHTHRHSKETHKVRYGPNNKLGFSSHGAVFDMRKNRASCADLVSVDVPRV